jgi:hypothetical protein
MQQQKRNCYETVFSVGAAPRLYKETVGFLRSRVEEGSNTCTAALLIVGGDKKGSLESERVKYAHESRGTQTQE